MRNSCTDYGAAVQTGQTEGAQRVAFIQAKHLSVEPLSKDAFRRTNAPRSGGALDEVLRITRGRRPFAISVAPELNPYTYPNTPHFFRGGQGTGFRIEHFGPIAELREEW